jgi:hypothetical protein
MRDKVKNQIADNVLQIGEAERSGVLLICC